MTHKPTSISLKDLPSEERPREKLITKGSRNLTTAELIALILRSGTRESSALELSRGLLAAYQNRLDRLSKCTIEELQQYPGIGPARATALVASFELGRRSRSKESSNNIKINSSAAAYHCMEPLLGHLSHEEFWVLFLNNAHTVLAKTCISSGGYTGTLVDVRMILKKALALSAVGLVLVHNHPSGTLNPSQADLDLTSKIVKAAKTIDITVLDHLIVTEKAYFSFADKHLL